MKINLDDKTNVLTYHKKLLAEAVKEKEELSTKLENFQSSSKGLSKLLNSQMSTRDKSGLGYRNQIHEGVLSYEKEVLESVFDSWTSDVENSLVNDRFAKVEGMHAIPPLMTGIYMPSKFNFGIDELNFTYGPKQSKTSESDAKTIEPKVVSQPKVWSDAPIIEEYESDSDDEYMIKPSKEQEKPSFAFVNTIKHVKTPSFSHLIRDCDFHEKRMAKQVELNKKKVNAARQNLSSQVAETSTARKVNTTRPIVNEIRQRNNFYKSHSPIRRPFNISTSPKANFTNHKVNTAGDKIVSAVRGYRETAVKALAGCNWRPKRHYWNKVSKYNSGSNSNKNDDPQKALKNKGIVDSGCSRHMTRNKAYLAEYQDYNGVHVSFRGSKGHITSKGCCDKRTPQSRWIKREYSNVRTPQQNGVTERKNKTLIEAARTMLADSFLPNTFWAEAVSTACYVLNRVLVTKLRNKTPYELITGTEDNIDAGDSEIEAESAHDYFVLPIWSSYTSTVKSSKAGEEPTKHPDFQQVN
ncbi:retrovirus-related pol polyprotein from transposon TNT 1-94 [Tanacetum coccineum]